ncbi:MAG: Arc family DNA binding domain-containing protein [Tepidisphaeraceae bacterium]|jgi:hypothetical protein
MAQRKSLVLRIDPALWTEIERWAQEELRSVNGQIEYLLKRAVVARGRKLKEGAADAPPEENQGQSPISNSENR